MKGKRELRLPFMLWEAGTIYLHFCPTSNIQRDTETIGGGDACWRTAAEETNINRLGHVPHNLYRVESAIARNV